jgi:hypothetical protein
VVTATTIFAAELTLTVAVFLRALSFSLLALGIA